MRELKRLEMMRLQQNTKSARAQACGRRYLCDRMKCGRCKVPQLHKYLRIPI